MSARQRLYPTREQLTLMLMHCAHARFVYNLGLQQRSMWTRDKRHFAQKITMASQMRELTQLRAELPWLREGSSVIQQGALRDLDRAFTNFYARRASYPTFKRRNDARGSFVVRNLRVRRINKKYGSVLIPKIGYVRFRLTRTWTHLASATSGRVTYAGNQWHVSFTIGPPAKITARTTSTTRTVGIDRGVANTLVTSDGQFLHAPTWTTGEQQRYVALQRRMVRQHKGSKRRLATKRAIAVLHRRLTDRRSDWVEQTTTALAREYSLIGLEDLRVTNMTRRPAPRPDPNQPGAFLPNRARAKAALNRAILASCWGVFASRLSDKMPDGHLVVVPAAYTSQQCRSCGYTHPDNRESQAVFRCRACGHADHADHNAACNIHDRAVALVASDAGSTPAYSGGTHRHRTHQPARVHPRAAASTTPAH